jgi:hypothetical protein
MREHRDALKAQARALQARHKYKHLCFPAIVKRLGWQKFKLLDKDSKISFVNKARISSRIRESSGRYQTLALRDVDDIALAELEVTPEKKKPRLLQRTLANIGKAFIDSASSIDSHIRVKALLSGGAPKTLFAAGDKNIKRVILVPKTPSPRKRGRPKGSGINDEAVVSLLAEHVSETCRWSHRANKVFKTLNGSVASVHRQDAAVHTKLSYRQLCRRIAVRSRQRLGIGAARKITDKCRPCTIWDTVIAKRSKKQIRDAINVLESHFADYWHGFEPLTRLQNLSWDSQDFKAVAIHADLERMAAFVESKATIGADARLDMEPAARDELGISEATVCDLLRCEQGILAAVTEYGMHWRLRDVLRTALHTDMREPAEDTIYLYEDFLDPCVGTQETKNKTQIMSPQRPDFFPKSCPPTPGFFSPIMSPTPGFFSKSCPRRPEF